MTFVLSDKDIQKIQLVFQTFPEVKKVILYGSRAKGNFRPGSDIDLVIQESAVDFQTMNRISSALEMLHLPYTFDLSVFEKISDTDLIDHINRIGKVFFQKK